jgi:hypothetical protein
MGTGTSEWRGELDESVRVEVGLVKDEICNGILLLLAPHRTDVCVAACRRILVFWKVSAKRFGVRCVAG